MGAKPKSGGVSADDAALFERALKDAKPLDKKAPPPQDEVAPAPPRAKTAPTAATPGPAPKRTPAHPELAVGAIAGVDRRTADKLRRGKLAIDGRLDLHGHDQAEAHATLNRYVPDAAARGARCVLVITGKGSVSAGGGVLRRNLPRWLNQPPCRAHVLAVTEARPEHGGSGAFYVMLKRQRAK